MVVHFICRGNAFRSIIAEAYLNSLNMPGLTVLSTGTVASQYKELNSVNFPKTLSLLQKHGIQQHAKDHYADDTTQEAIDKSDIIILLNEAAYNEAAGRFKLPGNAYVWDITDIGEKAVSLARMRRETGSQKMSSGRLLKT